MYYLYNNICTFFNKFVAEILRSFLTWFSLNVQPLGWTPLAWAREENEGKMASKFQTRFINPQNLLKNV